MDELNWMIKNTISNRVAQTVLYLNVKPLGMFWVCFVLFLQFSLHVILHDVLHVSYCIPAIVLFVNCINYILQGLSQLMTQRLSLLLL